MSQDTSSLELDLHEFAPKQTEGVVLRAAQSFRPPRNPPLFRNEAENDGEEEEEVPRRSSRSEVNSERFPWLNEGSLSDRFPWLDAWVANGSVVETLTSGQYPQGFDPRRNEKPLDRSLWSQEQQVLPIGWRVTTHVVKSSRKNPFHPLRVRYAYFSPTSKRFDGLPASLASLSRSVGRSSYSSRNPDNANTTSSSAAEQSTRLQSSAKEAGRRARHDEEGASYREEEDEEALSEEVGETFKVGDLVEVYWPFEEEWYEGEVDNVRDDKGVHVQYEDGDKEWLEWNTIEEEGKQLIRQAGERRKQHSEGSSAYSEFPWFMKWDKNGSKFEALTRDQYPPGYDPQRNDSEYAFFNKNNI